MAKVSILPLESNLNDSETVVMIKDNVTRRAALGGMVGAAVAPVVAATPLARTITLRELGVYGDGTDEAETIQSAVDEVSKDRYFAGRHITLLGDAGAAYHFTSDIKITRAHFTLDLMGAWVTTNWRFHFKGNPGDQPGGLEDDELLLEDVHFRNAKFGNPDDLSLPTRGPFMQYVRNSSLRNVARLSAGGSPFNLHFARNCEWSNVKALRARAVGDGGTIGILLLHTIGCTVRDFEISGPGEWVYCAQQKGGYGNRWINGHIHDITYAHPTGVLFRDRGDNPYNATTAAGSYPYLTGNYGMPDSRRASHNTQWINLTTQNTPDTMPAFASSESKGSRVNGLSVVNGRGVALIRHPRAPAGYDDGHQISGFRGDHVSIPLTAGTTGSGPMESLSVSDFKVLSMRATTLTTQRGILLKNINNAILRGIDIHSSGAVAENAIRHENVAGASYEGLNATGDYSGTVIFEDTATSGTKINGRALNR